MRIEIQLPLLDLKKQNLNNAIHLRRDSEEELNLQEGKLGQV